MSCCNSEPVDEQYERFSKSVKLLLLGTGESGKTTIIKQMKVLHINGFSDEEKKEKIPFIRQNVHESIYDIVDNMDKISPSVELEKKENMSSKEYILALGPACPNQYSEEYFGHVNKLWTDNGVQKTFLRSNEYQLIDSAEHFLNRIDVIKTAEYVPTTEDILFCRIRTTSISEIEFSANVPKKYGGGIANFLMYDVGGQRGERRKWIQVFEGINAVLFIIAASDFDLTLREDPNKNRLEESFTLFEDICACRFLRAAGMIVFLNKQDVFQKKIEQGKKLEDYFPEYESFVSSANSKYEKALAFLNKKIKDLSKTEVINKNFDPIRRSIVVEKLPPKDIHIHYTTAIDTNNVKKVFESVHEMIIKETLGTIY